MKKILTILFSLVFMDSFLAPAIFADNDKRVICSMCGNNFEVCITEQDNPMFDGDLRYCSVNFCGFISDDMKDKNLFKLLTDREFYYESTDNIEIDFFSKFVDEFARQKKFRVEFDGILPLKGDEEGIFILKHLANLL